jgi:hypothetical protein
MRAGRWDMIPGMHCLRGASGRRAVGCVAGSLAAATLGLACFGHVADVVQAPDGGDGTIPDAGRDRARPSDSSRSRDAGEGGDGISHDAEDDQPCHATVPSPTAVYVAPSGIDGAGCGAPTAPCATVMAGLGVAEARAADAVYVEEGKYPETIKLYSGKVSIVGGWIDTGGVWTRDLSSAATSKTTLASFAYSTTVSAPMLSGSSTLCSLTIASKATAGAGETLYGVFVTGPSYTMTLENVDIVMSAGGNGAAGSPGAAGASGSTAGCAAGSGATGTTGPSGAPGSTGSVFNGGYKAGDGALAMTGLAGAAGSSPGPPSCVSCISCSLPGCMPTAPAPVCGTTGSSGCGGKGGGPGMGGQGGGSSVAVFAFDNAVVQINAGVSLTAGAGGSGGLGGPGGPGGAGTNGSAGTSAAACCLGGDTCVLSGSCSCMGPTGVGMGGSAGGAGGNGGQGGAGGGGSGGYSCAILEGSGARVTGSPVGTLGAAGAGAGGAPNGKAMQVCSF